MKITIETIPHNKQRYNTVGDWMIDNDGNVSIYVSEMGNWRYEALVAVHELVEVLACKQACVSTTIVDSFDMDYEKNRRPGDTSEPGDDPRAPYCRQHCLATGIERILCSELGVVWADYENRVNAL